MKQERKYWVKTSWIFNLESMNDHVHCIIYDVEDGKVDFPFEVAGKEMRSIEDLEALLDECYKLEWTAKSGKVTGKEYGRIKEIVNYRVFARYARCLASGMDEARAGECFAEI